MGTTVMVLAFQLTSGDSGRYFTVVLSLAISTTTIAYIAVFPALIRLRYTHPDVPRPYRIPFGNVGAWVCSGLATFWALLATIALVWPGFGVGWFGTAGKADDALVSLQFAGQRGQYELSQIIPLVFLVVLGLVFYVSGRVTRSQMVEVPLVDNIEALEPSLA
jgi:amino acid transporter